MAAEKLRSLHVKFLFHKIYTNHVGLQCQGPRVCHDAVGLVWRHQTFKVSQGFCIVHVPAPMFSRSGSSCFGFLAVCCWSKAPSRCKHERARPKLEIGSSVTASSSALPSYMKNYGILTPKDFFKVIKARVLGPHDLTHAVQVQNSTTTER